MRGEVTRSIWSSVRSSAPVDSSLFRTIMPSTTVLLLPRRLPRTEMMVSSMEDETPSRFAKAEVTDLPGVVRMLSPLIRAVEVASGENMGHTDRNLGV